MCITILSKMDDISEKVNQKRAGNEYKDINEQFFTPMTIAYYMSSLFKEKKMKTINLLDPGAGIGNLTVAFVVSVCNWSYKPERIIATLYEIDSTLIALLKKNLKICLDLCSSHHIDFKINIINDDYLQNTIDNFKSNKKNKLYDYIVLNPPYKKLNSDSVHKKSTSDFGIDVPNYYAAFVSLSVRKLKKKGQLVFITPRSFCNGKYFKSFRNDLLNHIRIEKIHNFVSRNSLFYDNILQETIITLVSKNKQVLNDNIYIYESVKSDFSNLTRIQKRFDNIVFPDDHEKIIRIIKDDNIGIVNKINSLPCKLEQLNISVSTGPIVDFRVKKGLLSFENTQVAVPIIYPENFCCGYIEWPINGKKPPYLIKDISNINQLRPQGIYVLVKRVSSKEETKRIVAAVCYTDLLNNLEVGFDNKTNYYHISKQGLGSVKLAKGLSLFLNSSLVDFYFRTFSGSTQVNVSDLKSLKYPSLAQLEQLGSTYSKTLPTQVEIDNLINMILFK